jgi:hypothetical protein
MLKGEDYLEDEMNHWIIANVIIAFICLIGMTGVNTCFGIIGQNVTIKIRELLY